MVLSVDGGSGKGLLVEPPVVVRFGGATNDPTRQSHATSPRMRLDDGDAPHDRRFDLERGDISTRGTRWNNAVLEIERRRIGAEYHFW